MEALKQVQPAVVIEFGVPEDEQEGSFMNSTLQGAGDDLAFSVATEVEVPPEIAARGEGAVGVYLRSVLDAAAGVVSGVRFHVQMGPSREACKRLNDNVSHKSLLPRLLMWANNGLVHYQEGRMDDAENCAYEAGRYAGMDACLEMPSVIKGNAFLKQHFQRGVADAPLDAKAEDQAAAMADAGLDPLASRTPTASGEQRKPPGGLRPKM